MGLRDYQNAAIQEVRDAWQHGVRAVCLVAPTGAGKTVMGEGLIESERRVLWLAPRRDLVTQTHKRLSDRFGFLSVGMLMAGEHETPGARIQVGTLQTVLGRGERAGDSVIVLDECHHVPSDEWQAAAQLCPDARVVGLTATPQRPDGRPLGDVFTGLVVASNYSRLVPEGHLLPVRLYRPKTNLGRDWAQAPFDAWSEYGEGDRTFVFCSRVEYAQSVRDAFHGMGVPAAVMEADTPQRTRERLLEEFERGRVLVLCSVGCLTEGIDVPSARCAILARGYQHVSNYLQAAGRVLRPSTDTHKRDAIVLDLVGSSRKHGSPVDDRLYSLDGSGIERTQDADVDGAEAVAEDDEENAIGCRTIDAPDVVDEELEIVSRGALADGEEPKRVSIEAVKRRASKSAQQMMSLMGAYGREHDGRKSL